jgi:hypothetical protein
MDGTDRKVRAVAFYLPQFHPIPENDEWWGAGFTEWTNVARARPLFRGHEQPHLPADLGYYDLRVPEVRDAQARLACEYGVAAFCYWHYWFNGRRLLERPLQEVLASGKPDFPFCIGWANESWTGIWTGERSRVLLEQTYPGSEDDRRHFQALLPAFRDDRYFLVDGKPMLFLHRPAALPDSRGFAASWRSMAIEHGLAGLYLVGEATNGWRAADNGFDAHVRTPLEEFSHRPYLAQKLLGVSRTLRGGPARYPYRVLVRQVRDRATAPQPELPMVIPNWDNTPRSQRAGFILKGSSPSLFRRALEVAVDSVAGLPPDERIVFLKSWNEWAEGNYLEPDRRHGRAYLEAVRETVAAAGAHQVTG